MTWQIRKAAAAAALVALAAGCSSKSAVDEGPGVLTTARGVLASMTTTRKAAPAAPANPQAMAAEALSVNPGPLILAGLESQGTTQILAMTGENGGMRTFMTKGEQAMILRGFMVTGTRGLGHDLSVAEASESAALVAAGRSGTARRVMRYFAGDGKERPIDFTCRISPGPRPGVMVEDCSGHGLTFQNSYLPGAGVSRQWLGPSLGYVTVQVLRG